MTLLADAPVAHPSGRGPLVGVLARPRAVETGAAFWHMVDLVWVLLFPVVYLL